MHLWGLFFQYYGYLMACSAIHRLKGLQCKAVWGKVCCMHFPPQLWIHTLGSKPALNPSQKSRTGKPFAPTSCYPPIKRQQSSSQLGMLGPTWSTWDAVCGSDITLPRCNKSHGWRMGREILPADKVCEARPELVYGKWNKNRLW